MNRLGEYQVDRTTLDLTSDESSCEQEYDSESWEFYERKPKIDDDSFVLSESERVESERESNEDDREEYDERKESISDHFTKSIESNIEHRRRS